MTVLADIERRVMGEPAQQWPSLARIERRVMGEPPPKTGLTSVKLFIDGQWWNVHDPARPRIDLSGCIRTGVAND